MKPTPILTLAALLLLPVLPLAAAETATPAAPEKAVLLPASTDSGCPVNPQAVDSRRINDALTAGLTALYEQKKLVPQATILSQLNRAACELALPKKSGKKRELPAIYESARKSVMVVGGIYKCGRCTKMHLSFATGFMITETGVMVTNYHVAGNTTAFGLGAMDVDGNIYPVKEVLAASETQDIALVQLEGKGFTPLPLNPQAEIGSSVSIIGHPERNCYALSTGIISQYPIIPQKNGKTAQMMCVTAEYGVGSSGGPALNEKGEVVGMVSSTHTVVADPHSNTTTQMVMRYCTPAAAILNLVKPPAKK